MEIWKDVKGFEGLYQISSTGKVFSMRRNKEMNPKIDRYGYKTVTLYKNGNYYKTVHRLVAETFLEKIDGCNIVNHKDSNKLNNNVENLEWTTVSGNTKHCFENNEKFREQVLNNARRGTEKSKKQVVINNIKFESRKSAANYFGVNVKTIYNWLHN